MQRHRFMCAISGFIQAHVILRAASWPVSGGKRGNCGRRLRAVREGTTEDGKGRYEGERVKKDSVYESV